ncbi:MAG: hypothetical protein IPG93_09660 [Burkholderiales bacterium]|nr:hypothetical protein [Burkholderiales bacterium]
MLMYIMHTLSPKLQLGLEDLLTDLRHARRHGDLGRLVLLSYYEVRRWAKLAGQVRLAELSAVLLERSPYANRIGFMSDVDKLIGELEALLAVAAPVRWQLATRSSDALVPQLH